MLIASNWDLSLQYNGTTHQDFLSIWILRKLVNNQLWLPTTILVESIVVPIITETPPSWLYWGWPLVAGVPSVWSLPSHRQHDHPGLSPARPRAEDQLPRPPHVTHILPPLHHIYSLLLLVSTKLQRAYIYLLCFRLLYFYLKRRKPCSRCSCSEVSPPQVPKFRGFPPTSPRYVWTVESDPVYEDIIDVKNKVNTEERTVANSTKPPHSESEKKSSIQYGVITAKEVAKFVPCSEVIIRRWHWTVSEMIEIEI